MWLAQRIFRVINLHMFENDVIVKFYHRAYGDGELWEYGQMIWNFPRCPDDKTTDSRVYDALAAYCKRRDECLDLVTLTTLGELFNPE